jgi:DNA replication protein DnaC
MNQHTTEQKMRQLRLSGMADAYHQLITQKNAPQMSVDELLATLTDAEWERRQNKKTENLVRTAGFGSTASPTNVDYTSKRKLQQEVFSRLLTLEFIRQAENIIITGPTGIGKSYLAHALGTAACQMGMRTLCYSFANLAEEVKLARIEGSYLKLTKKIARAELLIIDDLGLHPFDNDTRQAFMHIIESRYEQKSTIITAQIPVSAWHKTIGEGTIADAILDRLVYSSHRLELQGESLRKNKQLKGI